MRRRRGRARTRGRLSSAAGARPVRGRRHVHADRHDGQQQGAGVHLEVSGPDAGLDRDRRAHAEDDLVHVLVPGHLDPLRVEHKPGNARHEAQAGAAGHRRDGGRRGPGRVAELGFPSAQDLVDALPEAGLRYDADERVPLAGGHGRRVGRGEGEPLTVGAVTRSAVPARRRNGFGSRRPPRRPPDAPPRGMPRTFPRAPSTTCVRRRGRRHRRSHGPAIRRLGMRPFGKGWSVEVRGLGGESGAPRADSVGQGRGEGRRAGPSVGGPLGQGALHHRAHWRRDIGRQRRQLVADVHHGDVQRVLVHERRPPGQALIAQRRPASTGRWRS